jgi:hypothetical protein
MIYEREIIEGGGGVVVVVVGSISTKHQFSMEERDRGSVLYIAL